MTEEHQPSERWTPDEHLADAALVGSQHMRQLADPDRAWVVAALKIKGLTAERIADLLHCSLRQVRAVAAEPATILATLYMVEREAFASESRMSASEIARLDGELKAALRRNDETMGRLSRMITMFAPEGEPGTFSCGCPKTRYNTYVHPATGKTSCREHRRLAVAAHRERKRAEAS